MFSRICDLDHNRIAEYTATFTRMFTPKPSICVQNMMNIKACGRSGWDTWILIAIFQDFHYKECTEFAATIKFSWLDLPQHMKIFCKLFWGYRFFGLQSLDMVLRKIYTLVLYLSHLQTEILNYYSHPLLPYIQTVLQKCGWMQHNL